MSLAAHLLLFLFAASAGTLTYIIHIAADHQRVDTRFLLAIVILLGFPIVSRPSMAGATIFYYGAGIGLTAAANYGFAFSITAANYGLSNALRGLANIIDDADTRQTGTQTTQTETGPGTGQAGGERLTQAERQQRLEQMRREATGTQRTTRTEGTTRPPTREEETVIPPDEITIWDDQ